MSAEEPGSRAEYDQPAARVSRLGRRRERIAAEIARNRRGEYTVPTWVLVVALLALVGGIAGLVVLS